MKTKFTPGTWYASKSAGGQQGIVAVEESGKTIAVIYAPEDAPVIAAAPKLYDALRSCVHVLREAGFISGLIEPEYDAAMQQAHAALAEAEGN